MDDLLQDLEELGDGIEPDDSSKSDKGKEEQEQTPLGDLLYDIKDDCDVENTAKLRSSKIYAFVVENIDKCHESNKNQTRDPLISEEHKLIVQANKLASEIDHEILVVHKFIRERYSHRFPELDTLVINPLDYARAVKEIGNKFEIIDTNLKNFLAPATVMVISVTLTTTKGKPLSDKLLKNIEKACDLAIELDVTRRKILAYVGSNMSRIAPNISALLNSSVSAGLMGIAGSIAMLARIPACDILVLGKSKKGSMGLSLATYHNHRGIIYNSDIIKLVPEEHKRRVARALSAKVCLAARIDLSGCHSDGSMGRKYREQIQKYIDLILQPPIIKAIRPLPIPDEGPKRRRAGRRFRGMKQMLQMSELKKAQNRLAFGVPEREIGFDTGESKGLGLIGTHPGRVRALKADTRFKLPVSKKYKTIGQITSNPSGFSSSVAFTPVKGIELENPDLYKTKKSEERYFSSTKFSNIKPKTEATKSTQDNNIPN